MTSHKRIDVYDLTGSGPWVPWGYTRQVQGTNGPNAAQLVRPQGSTLTFQHKAGASWATGLRHGVTMHPRGRHSREGMILPPHGTYNEPAREQQQTTSPHNHNHWDTTQPYNYWWKSWITRVNKEEGLGPYRGCQEIVSKGYHQSKFPLREASRGSSTTCLSLREKRCDSRLGPFKAQRNMVSQCNCGRRARL